ncbi:MAG TPA: glycosyltransferase family 39 protein [Stellaceae bacterium]|nr:glycosyltransferase family 39 protein [Stellaceae bacterium]
MSVLGIGRSSSIRLPSLRLTWTSGAWLLFGGVLLLVVATYRDYGVTWDEDVHNWYGVLVLDYYLSGFTDGRALHWQDLYNYGAAFDLTAAILNRVSRLGTYETRHLLDGIIGVAGLIGAWKLGSRLGGARAGFLAAVLLITIPNYYGQMFNNPKDIPFAVGTIWSLYYLCRIIPSLPRPPLSEAVKLGIATGLTLGVRVGGLLLIAYAGLALALFCVWRLAEQRSLRLPVRDGTIGALRLLVPQVLVAFPVMLLFWPWAQLDPLRNPLQALANFSHDIFPFPTLFAGTYVPASDVPWEYLPTFILLALPELTLALALVALPAAVLSQWRGRDRSRAIQYAILATAIIFPVAYAIAIKAVLFDGMRHFIFVLPPIAVAAGLAFDHLIGRLPQGWARATALGLIGVYGAGHLAVMAMLHPDEYVYYNGLVGGVEGAQTLFKTDYWANSYAEAVQGLTDYLRTEYGAEFEDHQFTVAVCGPPVSADYFFPDNFVFSKDRLHADFFIAFTKDECNKALPGKEVYRVERLGALLSIVLDRRELPPNPVTAAAHQ